MALTRAQVINQINQLEQEGYSEQEIQQYLDGLNDNAPPSVGNPEIAPEQKSSGPFRFKEVLNTEKARQLRTSRYKEDAMTSAAEAEKLKFGRKGEGLGGFWKDVKAFGRGVRETVLPSEVGLGETIRKSMFNQQDTYLESLDRLTQTQADLLKQIRKNEAAGKDTTTLKILYNESVADKQNLDEGFKEEQNLPTTGEAIGQLGGTALDVLSVGTYGKLGTAGMKTGQLATRQVPTAVALARGMANRPAGLFSKLGVQRVATGAGFGYASDVTRGLQGFRGEDRTGANAFIPGLGTAVGAAIPATIAGYQSFKTGERRFSEYMANSPKRIVANRTEELNKLESQYKGLRQITEASKKRGFDPMAEIAHTDFLDGAVDKNGTIRTSLKGGALNQMDDFLEGKENVVTKIIEKEGKTVTKQQLMDTFQDSLAKSNLSGAAKQKAIKAMDTEIEGLLADAVDGNIPLSEIQKAKIFKNQTINYLDKEKNVLDKPIVSSFKKIIEETTESADVGKLNAELSKYYTMREVLQFMDGKKVQGGRLGKYFAQTIGGIAGSSVGGPLGAVAGAEAGDFIQGRALQNTFKGKTGNVLQASDELLDAAGQRILGNRNTSQAITTNAISKSNIPQTLLAKDDYVQRVVKEAVDSGALNDDVANQLLKAHALHEGFFEDQLRKATQSIGLFLDDGSKGQKEAADLLARHITSGTQIAKELPYDKKIDFVTDPKFIQSKIDDLALQAEKALKNPKLAEAIRKLDANIEDLPTIGAQIGYFIKQFVK